MKKHRGALSLIVSILLSCMVVGMLGTFLTAGTYAAFSAQTTNANNTFSTGSMLMTNVAGSVVSGSNCTTGTSNGTCATLFNSSTTSMAPGASDKSNTVTITYVGSITTAAYGVYAANYSSKGGGSAATCTAADPASKLNFQIKQGATIIYPTGGVGYGTLAAFAAAYPSSGASLRLKGGTNGAGALNVWAQKDASTFTINVNLDSSSDNTYQGCQSLADLVWFAS